MSTGGHGCRGWAGADYQSGVLLPSACARQCCKGRALWLRCEGPGLLLRVQTETPDYWPPVEQTPEGLRIVPQKPEW